MKRMIKIMSVILSIVLCAAMLCACSDVGAPSYKPSPVYANGITAEKLSADLGEFLSAHPDRTSYTDHEKRASVYLEDKLRAAGYEEVTSQSFTAEEITQDKKKVTGLNSQNVVARYRSAAEKEKAPNVILGAFYDNRKTEAYSGSFKMDSDGALAGGTGVVTLLAIAEYLQAVKPELPFDVTIVFFGGSFYAGDGAKAFYNTGMTADERKRTVLMTFFERIGCDHLYAFADERSTKREKFIYDVAKANGLDLYKPTQKSPVITGVRELDGIPYYRWAHEGLYKQFFNVGIPTYNIIGGSWETANITDRETVGHENLAYTSADTLENLKKYHKSYADKMATAATLVIKAMEDPEFLNVMTYDREHFPDTDFLTDTWIWYLIVLAVMIASYFCAMAVSAHLRKKYPVAPIATERVKMAVFGMDYENKDDADIFVDIRPATPQEDIFPGIPNNDGNDENK